MVFKQKTGSRAQVMHGTAKMTGGGLKKKDLKYNKHGKIVSKKLSAIAKKEKRLEKAGWTTIEGQFGAMQIGGAGEEKGRRRGQSAKAQGPGRQQQNSPFRHKPERNELKDLYATMNRSFNMKIAEPLSTIQSLYKMDTVPSNRIQEIYNFKLFTTDMITVKDEIVQQQHKYQKNIMLVDFANMIGQYADAVRQIYGAVQIEDVLALYLNRYIVENYIIFICNTETARRVQKSRYGNKQAYRHNTDVSSTYWTNRDCHNDPYRTVPPDIPVGGVMPPWYMFVNVNTSIYTPYDAKNRTAIDSLKTSRVSAEFDDLFLIKLAEMLIQPDGPPIDCMIGYNVYVLSNDRYGWVKYGTHVSANIDPAFSMISAYDRGPLYPQGGWMEVPRPFKRIS